MRRGARSYLIGFAVLMALAGCGRGVMQFAERASWRHEAEVECLKSSGVKMSPAVMQVEPIAGPGVCGADFPLKVAALGESSAIGYADELRPPGNIPNVELVAPQPRWPMVEPRPLPPPEPQYRPQAPRPMQPARYAPATEPAPGAPMSIIPPGVDAPEWAPPAYNVLRAGDIPDDAILPQHDRPRMQPVYNVPRADDIPDDAILPQRVPPRTQPAYNSPLPLPALGPSRAPSVTGAIIPATVTPPATLSCPIVSALDRWVSQAVQPAAMHWFKQPVVEIQQISAYSCRSMNGQPGAHISEHAFGNALDIAGFMLADGRKITVKDSWNGAPEEQGFLHDVQLAACQQFSTVLAPGSNAYHYDHIHVDLMRRASGRQVCEPAAIPGEVAAARALERGRYARRGDPSVTGSISATMKKRQRAVPGDDGWDEDE